MKSLRSLTVTPLLTLIVLAGGAGSASAETLSPWWHVNFQSLPGNLPPGGTGELSVLAENFGDTGIHSSLVLSDRLPQGLALQKIEPTPGTPEPDVTLRLGSLPDLGPNGPLSFLHICAEPAPRELVCTIPKEVAEGGVTGAYGVAQLDIQVTVAPSAKSGEQNTVSVTGGGAPSAPVSQPIAVSPAPTPFGVQQYEMRPENADGTADTQAGSHPYQLSTVEAFNQTSDPGKPPQAVKDLRFDLPPGLIGNPTVFPQCSLAKFVVNAGAGENLCPDDTVVGIASVTVYFSGKALGPEGLNTFTVPVFNLTPSVGEPARFGFDVRTVPVYLDTSVRTGSDYGVTVSVDNVTELANFISGRVSFWGVPGDPRHDPVRGWNCLQPGELPGQPPCEESLAPENPPPLLTLPTSCAGPLQSTLESDSWEAEGDFTAPFSYTFKDNLGHPVAIDGCNALPFAPSIGVTPDVSESSRPSGLSVHLHVPQEEALNPEGLAPSEVRSTTVALPAGLALNPAAADGLEACTGNPADPPGSPGNEVGLHGLRGTEPGGRTGREDPAVPARAGKPGHRPIRTVAVPERLEGRDRDHPDAHCCRTR